MTAIHKALFTFTFIFISCSILIPTSLSRSVYVAMVCGFAENLLCSSFHTSHLHLSNDSGMAFQNCYYQANSYGFEIHRIFAQKFESQFVNHKLRISDQSYFCFKVLSPMVQQRQMSWTIIMVFLCKLQIYWFVRLFSVSTK